MENKKKTVKGFFDNLIGGIKKWATTPKEITIPARNPNLVSPDPQDAIQQRSGLITPEPPSNWTPPKPQIATPIQPTIAKEQPFVMNYEPYIADKSLVQKNYPQGLPQPTAEQTARIRQISPNDATRSAILKLTESNLQDYPKDYTGNTNQTIDRGPNMINSATFDWLSNHPNYGPILRAQGINTFDDMTDPLKNEIMMDVIRQVQGYGAWYAPKNKGFNILNQK